MSPATQLKNDLLNMASMKLMCAESYSPFLPNEACLAILDVVLSLSYEDRQENVNTTLSTMVARHMRIAYSIPVHRRYMQSGFPSEPILAEAASRQLWNMWKEPGRNNALRTLATNFDNCILDRSELRKLLGRKLLTYAYQKAVKKIGTATFSDGCKLIDMIGELFALPHAEAVLASIPDGIALQEDHKFIPFKEAFGNAMIRFTHFVRMGDINAVATDVLWAAYIRGMAFILPKNEDGVGVIIPVLLYDCLICKHVMSSILIQFKPRKLVGQLAKYSINENTLFGEWENCQHNNVSHIRPYITLTMDLRVTRHATKEAKEMAAKKPRKPATNTAEGIITMRSTPPVPQNSSIASNITCEPSSSASSRARNNNCLATTHPCYQILAYGCSSSVYKVIDSVDDLTYANLLGGSELFPEHPRQDPESISAVMQMKPLFQHGDNSYNWVEHPPLTPGKVGDMDVLGISVEEEGAGVKVGTPIQVDDNLPLEATTDLKLG